MWEREPALTEKQTAATRAFKVNYLKHDVDEHVISSQIKAWNDTIRLAMWIDLIAQPFKKNHCGGKLLIWRGNYPSLNAETIKRLARELGIGIQNLPVNMIYLLQVLDLIVNAIIKRHIRTVRAFDIANAFKSFRQRIQLLLGKSQCEDGTKVVVPRFKPPEPTLQIGIQNVIKLLANE